MSKPSAGCQTCRSRRIKCDGTKPICQRCIKSRRPCVERLVIKQATLSIHSENAFASGETKRPRGPRSSLTLFRPSSDLPLRARAYFLNYYLEAPPELPTISACMSECLVTWKASGRESKIVDLAVSSLALAIFSRTQKHPEAAKEAFVTYGRLLRLTTEQITQVKIHLCGPDDIDECLIAVVLMGWYETAMHQPGHTSSSSQFTSFHSWSHYDGAEAILRAWDLRHSSPSEIVKQTRRGMVRLALLRSLPFPSWMQHGTRFGEQGLDLAFDDILVRAANLCHSFKNLKWSKVVQATAAERLTQMACELDMVCQQWAAEIPSAWSYRAVNVTETSIRSNTDLYSSIVYVCANWGYATVWLQYFATRMLILSTSLSLLKLNRPPLPSDSTYERLHGEYNLQFKKMTDSLASIVPFCLERFEVGDSGSVSSAADEPTIFFKVKDEIRPARALPTVWPLSIASGLDHVEPAQKLWFYTQLARLGQVLGDGALERIGTDRWTHEPATAEVTEE